MAGPASLALGGEVDGDVAALFLEELARLGPEDAPVEIDLSDADIADASIVVMLVEHLREAGRRVGRLRLISPPQALAHTLYRIGALGDGGSLMVVEPREELGSSG